MGVKDPRCEPKSSIAQRRHTIMVITKTLGFVIGVRIDSGLVAHWRLHWVMESISDSGYGHEDIPCMTYDIHVDISLGCVWVGLIII